jgi:hypothetical protein
MDNKRLFLDEIYRRVHGETAPNNPVSDELRQQRTVALWAGLRRVYFAEPDLEGECLEGAPSPPRHFTNPGKTTEARPASP